MPAPGDAGDGGAFTAYHQQGNALPMLLLRQSGLFDSENDTFAGPDTAGCFQATVPRNRKGFPSCTIRGGTRRLRPRPISSSGNGRLPSSGSPAALSTVLRAVDLISLL